MRHGKDEDPGHQRQRQLKQCLYINKLADVDLTVLRKILEGGLAQISKDWPVTAS